MATATARAKKTEEEEEKKKKKTEEEEEGEEEEEEVCLFVCWLDALSPSHRLVYLRDGSAQTILRAATLRYKLQIQRSTSPSHSILTPGRPVPVLTL